MDKISKKDLSLEALVPGKPLTFLDHHIRVGNSLLGAKPSLFEVGLPDETFNPLEGDDPKYCRELVQQNRKERDSQVGVLFGYHGFPWDTLGNYPTAVLEIENLPEDTPAQVQEKYRRYAELVGEGDYLNGRLLADAWCAAYVWREEGDLGEVRSHNLFLKKSHIAPRGGEGH